MGHFQEVMVAFSESVMKNGVKLGNKRKILWEVRYGSKIIVYDLLVLKTSEGQ